MEASCRTSCSKATMDESFVLAVGTNALWQRLLQVLNLEEHLASDRRFATNADRTNHRDVLVPLLQKQFALLPTATWVSRLMAANIPAAPIQTVGEALSDPQTLSRALVVEIEHPTLKTVRSIANPIRLENQPAVYRFPPPFARRTQSPDSWRAWLSGCRTGTRAPNWLFVTQNIGLDKRDLHSYPQ